MKSFFKSLFSWNTSHNQEPKRLLLLGLDASGKTTFLYQIKSYTDEVVTTIPTIGFNVETVESRNLNFTCWDVGGCDKIRPLWRHYMNGTSAMVFMIDSNDSERIESANEELHMFLKDLPLSVPLLVIANKRDLPRIMALEHIIVGLGLDQIKERAWEIMPCVATRKADAQPCLEWIQTVLAGNGSSNFSDNHGGISNTTYFQSRPEKPSSTEPVPEPVLPPAPVEETEEQKKLKEKVQQLDQIKFDAIWEDWLSRARNIPSTSSEDEKKEEEIFLKQLQEYNLPSWDHYHHIRIAYLLLKYNGLLKGFEKIEISLRDYIANNQIQTNGKSFHATMTRFWCHMVAYWMMEYSLNIDQSKESRESLSLETSNASEFYKFLLFVVDQKTAETDISQSALFRHYYSNDVIFHADARSSVTPPNLKPLPEIRKNQIIDGERTTIWKFPSLHEVDASI